MGSGASTKNKPCLAIEPNQQSHSAGSEKVSAPNAKLCLTPAAVARKGAAIRERIWIRLNSCIGPPKPAPESLLADGVGNIGSM